jgi:hypothetical protein
MNYINIFFGYFKEKKNANNKIDDITKDLYYRKIKNFLRKHSANTGDDYQLRLRLQQLFYYDINGIPIAKLKPVEDIYKNENYPYFFKYKTREEIINIYNKEVKTKYLINIYNEDELNDYNIKPNIYLDISLKTFRPVYKEDWKKISEEINEVSFDKQNSFYADYLRCYMKLTYFPSFDDFITYIYNKYKKPVHKDIKIVYNNIDKSYKDVRDYIKNNNMTFQEVRKIIMESTSISNRVLMETVN